MKFSKLSSIEFHEDPLRQGERVTSGITVTSRSKPAKNCSKQC
jgi:hypothetical protein